MLKPRPNNQPGVFCCKCGKHIARSKHIHLKITSQPCPQKDSIIILQEEGFNRSQSRLDALYRTLQSDYNSKAQHTPQCNRKLGKILVSEDDGVLQCTTRHRMWKWKDRASLYRTINSNLLKPPRAHLPPSREPQPSSSKDTSSHKNVTLHNHSTIKYRRK